MNLYLISQDRENGYDTYDSAVVVAESPEEAAKINPDGYGEGLKVESFPRWVSDPADVKVKLIGEAVQGSKSGTVICASFNAG